MSISRFGARSTDIRWMGTAPPNGQGLFAVVDGKQVGGVLPSALAGQRKGKPFAAHVGEWLEFERHCKTLDEAKDFIVEKYLRYYRR